MIKSFKSLVGKSGLHMLESLWKTDLQTQSHRNFTHSYHYYAACLQASQVVEKGPELEFINAFSEGGGGLIAPLERIKRRYAGYPIKVLRSPLAIYVPYWDIINISQSNESTQPVKLKDILKSSIAGQWDVIQLYNVLENSYLFSKIQKEDISWQCWESPHCDYLLCQGKEDFLAGLSKNFRANLRKARNRLYKIKNVHFYSHRDSELVKKALQNFFLLEMAGWKGSNKSAIAQNLKIREFYEILFDNYPKDRHFWCEVNELHADCNILASQICLGMNDTLYILKVAYDENFFDVSPGNMLLEWVLTRPENDGHIRYINLISDSEWHKDWKASFLRNWYIEIYNKTLGGLLIRTIRLLQRRMQKKTYLGHFLN